MKISKLLVGVFLFSSVVRAQQAADVSPQAPLVTNECDESCGRQAMAELTEISSKATTLVLLLTNLDPAILEGTRVPQWQDFSMLQSLIIQASEVKTEIAASGKQNQFITLLPKIQSVLRREASVQKILAAAKSTIREASFKASEYEMKLQYVYALNDLNSRLPSALRVPFRHIPFDKRRAYVTQKGRALVRELEPKFEALFNARGPGPGPDETPYDAAIAPPANEKVPPQPSFAELSASLRGTTDPELQDAFSILDQGQLRMIIRRPESARFWLPKVGFHNQYVSGTSRGYNNNDYRKGAEAQLLGIEKDRTLAEDPETLPKYGTMAPAPDSNLPSTPGMAAQYGDDVYYIKLDHIADRLTFTFTDSLGLTRQSNWEGRFIPWKYRDIMVPFIAGAVKGAELSRPTKNKWFSALSGNYSTYWEIQIFGSLRLSDMDAMKFGVTPPSGMFLLELLKNDIAIYDGSKTPVKRWYPKAADIEKAKTERGYDK